MKKALELVRTRQGSAMMEIQSRFDILLHGKKVGQLYFNLRGYVGSLPTPDGLSVHMPESSIASFQRDVSGSTVSLPL